MAPKYFSFEEEPWVKGATRWRFSYSGEEPGAQPSLASVTMEGPNGVRLREVNYAFSDDHQQAVARFSRSFDLAEMQVQILTVEKSHIVGGLYNNFSEFAPIAEEGDIRRSEAAAGGAAGGIAATTCGPACAGAAAAAVTNLVTNGLSGTVNPVTLATDTATGALTGWVLGGAVPYVFKNFVQTSIKGDIGEGLTALGL
jgi:hypothetical protein